MDPDDLFDSKALEEAKKLPRGKGREMFTYLSPEEFLSLTPDLDPVKGKLEGIEKAIGSGKGLKDIPFLGVDEAGKVIGHEGRHRAMVLAKMGVKKFPVVFRSKNVRWNAQSDPSNFDYIKKLPRLITPQKGAANPNASVRAPYQASGPSRGLVRVEQGILRRTVMARDPDKIEYDRMTKMLNEAGESGRRPMRAQANWARVQGAQDAISRVGVGAERVFGPGEARWLLNKAGIEVINVPGPSGSANRAPMAIHPLTGRRVPAVVLASEIDNIADTLDLQYPGRNRSGPGSRFNEAAEALRTGAIPSEVRSAGWPEDVMKGRMRKAIEGPRGEAADTHLKRGLKDFAHNQRVAADIADPSVMEGMRKGIDRADKSTARRLAATALRGTGRLAGGALGLAGSMPAEIALRAMGRPDDMTVAEDYRQDEALVAGALNLPRRDEMRVYSLPPERRAAAMMALRSGLEGLRPPPVKGVIQDAITEAELQFLREELADPGNPTVSRPRYEAPKAAPRSNELK